MERRGNEKAQCLRDILLPLPCTGQYFSAVDLAQFARDLDEAEWMKMTEGDVDTKEYLKFMEVCAMVLLPWYCSHSVAKIQLPWHCCSSTAAIMLLPWCYCHGPYSVVQLFYAS